MAMALESMEHEVVWASSGAEDFREIRIAAFDAVFLDLKLHQENGLETLEGILRMAPEAAVVIVTAFTSIETAVEAMRLGAFDYLPKPCRGNRSFCYQLNQKAAPFEWTKAEVHQQQIKNYYSYYAIRRSPDLGISRHSDTLG